MEMSALLLSKDLNKDVCICIYDALCILKRLPVSLNNELLQTYMFNEILKAYHDMHNIKFEYLKMNLNTLCWLENDMIGNLNDFKPLRNGLSDYIKINHPRVTVNMLIDGNSGVVNNTYIYNRLLWLWILMDTTKKKEFHKETFEKMNAFLDRKDYPITITSYTQ